jgi:C4-dicarboxylate transporter DctM subunit
MIPLMVERGYRRSYCAALTASASFLGTFIPPSVPGIMYALSSGAKVSEVWLSTVVPGIIFMIVYVGWNTISQWNTEAKVSEPFHLGKYFKTAGQTTWRAVPAILMPVIIFGGIYGGIFTPTEAGAVSCVYGVLFLAVRYFAQKFTAEKGLHTIAKESMVTTAMIGVLLVFAKPAGYVFTLSGVSDSLAVFVAETFHGKVGFLLVVNFIFLIMGCILDLDSAILIMTPLLLPSVLKMGITPVHFGAIMLTNLNIGALTPPLALQLYFGAAMAEADVMDVIKDVIPFIILGVGCVLLTSFMPVLSDGFVGLFR